VLESYQQLETKIGVPQDQLLRLKPLEDRDAWHGPKGVFAKLGRPENAEGYELPEVSLGEGGTDLTPSFRKFAFEQGLSKGTAEATVQWFAENVTTAQEALDLTRQAEQVKQLEAVRIEWGADWTPNVSAARRGMSMLGIDENMASAIEGEIGTKEFLGRMLNVGKLLGEHSAGEHGSGQAGSYLSQEESIAEISTLKANKTFMDVWVDGNADGNAEARQKMDALMAIAYPG